MEEAVIVKIARPSAEQETCYEAEMGMEKFACGKEHGQIRVGKPFVGELTVAVTANAGMLQIVCRVLQAARIPYSLHDGRPVKGKAKPCTSPTQSTLTMVELMSEVQPTTESGSGSTIPASATVPEENAGKSSSS